MLHLNNWGKTCCPTGGIDPSIYFADISLSESLCITIGEVLNHLTQWAPRNAKLVCIISMGFINIL